MGFVYGIALEKCASMMWDRHERAFPLSAFSHGAGFAGSSGRRR